MRILFFAQLKNAAGCSEVEWKGVGRLSAEELWRRLLRDFPGLSPHRPAVRLARNGAYVRSKEVFEDEDEVALIPPVSGG